VLLLTERLALRELTRDDLTALKEILQDDETMIAYEGPFSNEEAEHWLECQFERYRDDGYGWWAVLLRETGVMIGQCGLTGQEIEGNAVLEVGYMLNREFWHFGYATEAARACLDYAFNALAAERVWVEVRDTNLSSRRVAERLGMAKVKSVTKHYRGIDMPHLVFALDRKS
jgi:RimJ/RimL family protein N-acetyltransferase